MSKNKNKSKKCKECLGRGYIVVYTSSRTPVYSLYELLLFRKPQKMKKKCEACDGKGFIVRYKKKGDC